jgi:hypothetical protein
LLDASSATADLSIDSPMQGRVGLLAGVEAVKLKN